MCVPLIFIRASDDVTPEVKETDRFDDVVSETEKLTHPTANRAKPPQRRPPSGLITAFQVSELFLRFVFPTRILSMTFATWVCQATALGSDTRVSNCPPGTWCVFDSINTMTFSHVFFGHTERQPLFWFYMEFYIYVCCQGSVVMQGKSLTKTFLKSPIDWTECNHKVYFKRLKTLVTPM